MLQNKIRQPASLSPSPPPNQHIQPGAQYATSKDQVHTESNAIAPHDCQWCNYVIINLGRELDLAGGHLAVTCSQESRRLGSCTVTSCKWREAVQDPVWAVPPLNNKNYWEARKPNFQDFVLCIGQDLTIHFLKIFAVKIIILGKIKKLIPRFFLGKMYSICMGNGEQDS